MKKTFPRWNNKKANWNLFSQLTNKYSKIIKTNHYNIIQQVKNLNSIRRQKKKLSLVEQGKIIDLIGQQNSKKWKIW